MIGAHHIKDTGFRLHYIRAAAAGIRNGIMDARLITHMLPQILDAGIHQFHRIQRAASHLGCTCRMRSNAVELVLGLDAGIGGTCRRIQISPDTISCHKGLGRTALFSRTAIQDHRASCLILFQISLHSKCRSHGTGPQDIMTTTVSASTFLKRLLLDAAGSLG